MSAALSGTQRFMTRPLPPCPDHPDAPPVLRRIKLGDAPLFWAVECSRRGCRVSTHACERDAEAEEAWREARAGEAVADLLAAATALLDVYAPAAKDQDAPADRRDEARRLVAVARRLKARAGAGP